MLVFDAQHSDGWKIATIPHARRENRARAAYRFVPVSATENGAETSSLSVLRN